MKCVICNKEYEGYGNNAEPIAKGMCCDNCNTTYVIPAKVKQLKVENKLNDSTLQECKDDDTQLRRFTGNLIREEVNAVEQYDDTMRENKLTPEQQTTLEEIRNDEIDHTDKLNNIYQGLKEGAVEDSKVYHITKEQWNKIPSDYKMIDPKTKEKKVFAAFIYPNGGTTLLTEGKHFIIDDSNIEESFAGQHEPADVNEPVEAQDDFDSAFKTISNLVGKAVGFHVDSNNEVEKMKDGFIRYKGYDIEHNFYGKGEYTVQYQGDDVWFKTEQEAKKFIDEISGIKDDAQEVQPTLEENEISNSIQDDLDRDIYEGWTPRDFIKELEPQFDRIIEGKSWQKPFSNKEEIKQWCMSEQPFYKKYVPEVVSYFVKKWESAKNNSLYDNAEVYGDGEEVEEQIEALSENTVEARDGRDYSQYVGRNLYEVAKELGITGWNRMDDFFTYTFYNGNQSIEFETDGRGTIKGVKANMKDCNTVHDSDTVNDIGMYAKGSKYRWEEKYGNAQLTLMCVCEDDTIKLSLDNADLYVKLPREKFESMLRNKEIVCTDTARIDGYDRIKTQDKKFSVKVGDRQFIVKAKDSLEARNKIKAKFAK